MTEKTPARSHLIDRGVVPRFEGRRPAADRFARMGHSMRGAGDRPPQRIADGIITLIDRLPPSDGLRHCDLHAGSVILTADGSKVVD